MEQAPLAKSTPAKKRTRKANWTQEESGLLLELYRANAHVLRNNFSNPGCTNQAKQKIWEKIQNELQQAFPSGMRTVRECQKRYHTILMTSRQKLSQARQDYASTGKIIWLS